MLTRRSAPAVHELDQLLQPRHQLGVAVECHRLKWQAEALPGYRLGARELFEPVRAVNAAEARVTHAAKRERGHREVGEDTVDRHRAGVEISGQLHGTLLAED